MKKSPKWVRAVQIILGALAIILAIVALTNSGLTILLILIAIVLVITGFEKTITGLFIAHNLRFFTIGLGVLTIILAGLALTYPIAAARVLLLILGFSLMVDGFSRIADGLTNKSDKRLVRGFTIAVGILGIIISVGINIIPFWGKLFISKLIAVDLIIIGIQMITTGTFNVEAGKKKLKERVKENVRKIFQGHDQSEEKK
ncbi:MAG TPA: DUF308 domain-containing protein [Nitrososphaeraceae archaeon]|nr:DUF308 domain-containing protein [Nitrososphaeraceae archaeon]